MKYPWLPKNMPLPPKVDLRDKYKDIPILDIRDNPGMATAASMAFLLTVNERLAQPEHLSYPSRSLLHDLTQETPVPTVYLIAQPTVKRDGALPDLTPLSEYGEVKVLVNSGEYPSLHPERCRELIEVRLANFDQDRDYLAWAGGDTLAAVFTGIVLERMGLDRVKWLKFQRGWDNDGEKRDPDKSYYREVKVTLYEKLEPGTPDTRD